MKINDYTILLLTCLVIHVSAISSSSWLKNLTTEIVTNYWNISVGIALLFYPVFGGIADVCVSRYTVIKLSFILLLFGSVLATICAVVRIATDLLWLPIYFSSFVLIVSFLGMGLFEANAIQFGLQLLIDASSEQLTTFIRWYFWCLHVGYILIYYITISIFFYFRDCKLGLLDNTEGHAQLYTIFGWLLFTPCLIQILCSSLGLGVFFKYFPNSRSHQSRFNPFKKIFEILRYTWKHKQPERRSAFTYWENSLPSRIDLGKEKYGGPFTNEDVEDMKTFFRLLLLLLSLFGFFFKDDGEGITSAIINTRGCPSTGIFVLLIANPENIKYSVILFGIPLYTLITLVFRKYHFKYSPKLLTRIKFGLILCLIQQSLYPFLLYGLSHPMNQEHIQCGYTNMRRFLDDTFSSTTACLLTNMDFRFANGTCSLVCQGIIVNTPYYYFLLLPQILSGISSLLVFMTVLEFICAQAPHTMKGLFIGLWYAMSSIKYLLVTNVYNFFISNFKYDEVHRLVIFSGVKGFMIFVSLISFIIYSRFYRYRERNEVINEQLIIEEQYERELLLENNQENVEASLIVETVK